MKIPGGRTEGYDDHVTNTASGPMDRVGLRSTLAARLSGFATQDVSTVAEPSEPRPNGAATTVSAQSVPAADAVRAHAPNPIDIHVGSRMRVRRRLLGMSQKALADALGITFQQVQKLERGVNRIAAGRLHDISRALGVPISFFFEALPTEPGGGAKTPRGTPPKAARDAIADDTLHSRETLNLIRAYHTVPDPALRARILDLVRSLESAPSDPIPTVATQAPGESAHQINGA